MAAGRPVALAIDGVIREVVEAAECGLFSEPGNPRALAGVITKLAGNRTGARQMGLNGRKYLERNFHRERTAEQLIKLIEGTVNLKGRCRDEQ
jgi:glycosyltransferase involved in cell wall biosynthesis